MSELLTDDQFESVARRHREGSQEEFDDDVTDWRAVAKRRHEDRGLLLAHIDALRDEIADRDGAIERITEDLNEAHRDTLRTYEQAQVVNAELTARVGELVAQLERTRNMVVSLDGELAAREELEAHPIRYVMSAEPTAEQLAEWAKYTGQLKAIPVDLPDPATIARIIQDRLDGDTIHDGPSGGRIGFHEYFGDRATGELIAAGFVQPWPIEQPDEAAGGRAHANQQAIEGEV